MHGVSVAFVSQASVNQHRNCHPCTRREHHADATMGGWDFGWSSVVSFSNGLAVILLCFAVAP
jgi:hypothetical protein